jgi:PBP1b-binding outer membrane lipoprotein LpoB
MTDMRVARYAVLAVLLAACSAPAPQQRVNDAELAAMATIKHQYGALVSGFEIRPQNTLIVSVDLQEYIESDDQTIAAMKRDTLARWRTAWLAAHPHAHDVLHVRFIDFIGRHVATETTRV